MQALIVALSENARVQTKPGEEVGHEGDLKHIPFQLRHCTVAVHKKGHSPDDAWKICRASLKRQGYMKSRALGKPTNKSMKRTQKGNRRQMKHTYEPDAEEKHAAFARIVKQIKLKR